VLEARGPEELEALAAELRDRYGHPPASMEKIFYVGAVKLFARLYGWEKAEVYPERVAFSAGRELRMPAGKAFQLPELRLLDPGNFELEFTTLENFMVLGRKLSRLFD
jgi:transcription-repair coupling factor (superfamily II helicase)